ncbi:MAG: 50S ribosomal protein L11 methyltransferase, partial [Magnetococcus sp. THC-1_WYH]
MVWEVQLTAPEGAEEACSDILTAAGSQGSVMEWLPEDNAPVRVKGFFPDDIHHEQVKLHLLLLFAASSLAIPFETIHWRHIPDQDWTESWKKEIRPFPVGHRFLIRPSWWPPEDSDR